jgi:hypothetical protein
MTTAAIAAGRARCHPADGVTRLIMASESAGRILHAPRSSLMAAALASR